MRPEKRQRVLASPLETFVGSADMALTARILQYCPEARGAFAGCCRLFRGVVAATAPSDREIRTAAGSLGLAFRVVAAAPRAPPIGRTEHGSPNLSRLLVAHAPPGAEAAAWKLFDVSRCAFREAPQSEAIEAYAETMQFLHSLRPGPEKDAAVTALSGLLLYYTRSVPASAGEGVAFVRLRVSVRASPVSIDFYVPPCWDGHRHWSYNLLGSTIGVNVPDATGAVALYLRTAHRCAVSSRYNGQTRAVEFGIDCTRYTHTQPRPGSDLPDFPEVFNALETAATGPRRRLDALFEREADCDPVRRARARRSSRWYDLFYALRAKCRPPALIVRARAEIRLFLGRINAVLWEAGDSAMVDAVIECLGQRHCRADRVSADRWYGYSTKLMVVGRASDADASATPDWGRRHRHREGAPAALARLCDTNPLAFETVGHAICRSRLAADVVAKETGSGTFARVSNSVAYRPHTPRRGDKDRNDG